jgi:hypothetical protein
MSGKCIYTIEQLQRLTGAHKTICAQRGVEPNSEDGRDLTTRLLDACSGHESETEMLRRFWH